MDWGTTKETESVPKSRVFADTHPLRSLPQINNDLSLNLLYGFY
jgi:hypothetical protein